MGTGGANAVAPAVPAPAASTRGAGGPAGVALRGTVAIGEVVDPGEAGADPTPVVAVVAMGATGGVAALDGGDAVAVAGGRFAPRSSGSGEAALPRAPRVAKK